MRGSWGHLGSKLRFSAYLGANFGGSWPDLGSKMGVLGSILAPKWRPKSMKLDPKSDPKGDHVFDIFVHRLWERFGANLAPKTLPKWSQIGSKIDASWGVDLTLVLEGILAPFLLIFDLNMPRLEYLKSIKNVELSPNLLVFRYCGWCVVELTL